MEGCRSPKWYKKNHYHINKVRINFIYILIKAVISSAIKKSESSKTNMCLILKKEYYPVVVYKDIWYFT